jgi:hypothetical protein
VSNSKKKRNSFDERNIFLSKKRQEVLGREMAYVEVGSGDPNEVGQALVNWMQTLQ